MLKLVISKHSLATGAHLAEAIRAEGGSTGPSGKAIVSYGVRIGKSSVPVLNALAGMEDKYEQLQKLGKAGVPVPNTYLEYNSNCRFPLLARKREHRAGRDIMPVFQAEEMPWRRAAGFQFFSEFIPIRSELRTWVYRGNHLGTYRKSMVRPAEFRRIGWTYKNGFSFDLVGSDSVPRGAVDIALAAVKALGLDFGAVDIIEGQDDGFRVLEVNTAPGVESPTRQPLVLLARHIVKWEKTGCPKRT